jgi:hypothetical protein
MIEYDYRDYGGCDDDYDDGEERMRWAYYLMLD